MVSPSDPAAQWTGANKGQAFFAYATNYLIDIENAVIMDVEASRAIRQAEVGASRTMWDRTAERFGLTPKRVIADSAYGSAHNLAWLVKERRIEPHIPVFDKSQRTDGTFSRDDFVYDYATDRYCCPAGKELLHGRRPYKVQRSGVTKAGMMCYRASRHDCSGCALKPHCCPKEPARKIPRSIHEDARDVARDIAKTEAYRTSCKQRKKGRDAVRASEAHYAAGPTALARTVWRQRRIPAPRDGSEFAKIAKLRSAIPAVA